MFTSLEETLLSLAYSLQLEWFVFVASIVEEIIAPIPSPTVMVVAGSVANVQLYGLKMLVILACIGALGKTCGALVVYEISHRAENFVMRHFGRYIDVTPETVEKFGKKIGTGSQGLLTLTLFRALPIVPSVLVSVGSGILKVPRSIFILSAFFGTIFRDGFYLYVGYVGTDSLRFLVTQSTHVESIIEYVSVIGVFGASAYFFYRQKKKKTTPEC